MGSLLSAFGSEPLGRRVVGGQLAKTLMLALAVTTEDL